MFVSSFVQYFRMSVEVIATNEGKPYAFYSGYATDSTGKT